MILFFTVFSLMQPTPHPWLGEFILMGILLGRQESSERTVTSFTAAGQMEGEWQGPLGSVVWEGILVPVPMLSQV